MAELAIRKEFGKDHLTEAIVVEWIRREMASHFPARSGRELDMIERVIRLEEGQKNLSEQMDKRFEQMQIQMDKRFEQMQIQIDKRFEQVDKRFEQTQAQIDKRFWGMQWTMRIGITLILAVQSVIFFFVR